MKRIRLEIAGTVQGVGFRPFAHRAATSTGLSGFVYNHAAGVTIEAQGDPAALDRFRAALERDLPPLARIESLAARELPLVADEAGFLIRVSRAEGAHGILPVPPDAAPCAACLAEMEDPADRRFDHPFANCTHCGPRYSILRALPYDRAATAMAGFPLCPACAAEYADPADRRFHAQPVCCPACGPRLAFETLAPATDPAPGSPLDAAAAALAAGRIVAVKGVGGFHLAATVDGPGLARLRSFKHREAKPFAAMAVDLAAAETACLVTAEERAALVARERPVVLLAMRPGSPLSPCAPGLARAGVMLPSSPLHHLLMRRMTALGHPRLIMTSANLAGEPLCADEGEVRARLAEICDALLTHDRAVVARIDDSVLSAERDGPRFLRRARGYAPAPVPLARCGGRNLLCAGGDLKSVFALAGDGRAILSPHIGDLEHPETADHLLETVDRLARLHDFRPDALVVDAHPGYHSARLLAGRFPDLPVARVFHHEAHAGAILAEHRAEPPAVVLAFDGAGYGRDGSIWGGECLAVLPDGIRRAGRLRPLPLFGGDAAARSPARAALGFLAALLPESELLATPAARRHPEAARVAVRVARNDRLAVPCSSAGRLFDVAACLAGVRDDASYEAQAAMEFEALLDPSDRGELPLPVAAAPGIPDLLEADGGALLLALRDQAARSVPTGALSARFHRALARAAAEMAARTAETIGARVVGLSGGCFLNGFLLAETRAALAARGLVPLVHRLVPPGDGGLCLGQAWVADRAKDIFQ